MNSVVELIVDDSPGRGDWNMAVDQALLEESLQTGTTFVRVYRWSEPTVSLGYFQNADDRLADARLADLPFVRRLTGGGAILHDRELTYSCCVPPAHPAAQQPYRLYETAHAAIQATLRAWGAELRPRGHESNRPEPFLCFLRQAAPDLLVQGQKVLGSAQRRRRGAVLQHGSLLLHASDLAPELPGLLDLVPNLAWSDSAGSQLGRSLAQTLGTSAQTVSLPDSVRRRALLLVSSR